MNTTQNAQTQYINLSEVDIPESARAVSPEGLESIQRDLQDKGQLQEIIVAEKADGRKELVAGQRRFLGMKALGWQEARARVLPLGTSELDKALVTIAENEEREDVSPIDKGLSYKRAMEAGSIDQAELARRLGKTRAAICQYAALGDIPGEQRRLLNRFNNLGLAHLLQILRLPKPEDQVKLAEEASKEGLTSKEVQARVKKLLDPAHSEAEAREPKAVPDFQFKWKDRQLVMKARPFRTDQEGASAYLEELGEAFRKYLEAVPAPEPKMEEVAAAIAA